MKKHDIIKLQKTYLKSPEGKKAIVSTVAIDVGISDFQFETAVHDGNSWDVMARSKLLTEAGKDHEAEVKTLENAGYARYKRTGIEETK